MNNKVKIIIATVAVGMAVTLSACDGCGGCAGCGGSSSSATLTRSNWFTGTSYNGIQPSFIEGHESFSKEKITYEVTYDDTNATNEYVAVNYDKGVFTTEFYGTKYDWTSSAIPEGYADEKIKSETVYYYRTELTISVQYTLLRGNKDSSKKFDDYVITESYFRAAGKNLQPVYSKQQIVSTSPANYQPSSLKDAYKEIKVTYENFYDYNCTKVLSTTTDYTKDDPTLNRLGDGVVESKEFKNLNKLSNTLFDNSSLYIAVRAMKFSSGLSQPVALFSPAAGGIDEYAIVSSDASLTSKEIADCTDALKEKGLYIPAENDDKGVKASAVTVSYAGGNLHGTSQTIWYATVVDNDYNVSRATMLKLSVPISFSLGTLNYSLKSVDSTLWNG